MKVIDVRQRSPEWHAWRVKGISATSASVIVGENPEKTQWRLWCELSGKITPADLSMIPQVRLAIMLESHALAWFEREHGVVALPVCGESLEYPVIRASFDGLLECMTPVEVKVLSDGNFADVQELQTESYHYKLYWWQVQHQMYVSGGKKGYLVFYHTRITPIVFEILRDDSAIQKMVFAELDFWAAVQNGTEPKKCLLRDFFSPEGAAAGEWYSAAATMRSLEAEKLDLKARMAQIELEQEGCKTTFLSLMGDHLLADCEGVRVTRYMQSGRVSWKDIVMKLDPKFSEAKYPTHCGKAAERVKVTIDDDAPVTANSLEYGLGSVELGDAMDFCV